MKDAIFTGLPTRTEQLLTRLWSGPACSFYAEEESAAEPSQERDSATPPRSVSAAVRDLLTPRPTQDD